MNLTKQTEEKLGFQEIRAWLSERTVTQEGQARVHKMSPYRKLDRLDIELLRTTEMRDMLLFDEAFSVPAEEGLLESLDRAEPEGSWLPPEEFWKMLDWLRGAAALRDHFHERREKYPQLWEQVQRGTISRELIKEISRVIDERGGVRSDASPRLSQIREQATRVSADLRQVLQRVLRDAQRSGFAPEGGVTMRNDRFVIPLLADFKGRVPGLIHDVSSSGQTLFIEPSQALEFNNLLRTLEAEERNEIIRILRQLTDALRKETSRLRFAVVLVGEIDFLRAKGRLAVELRAVKPHTDWDAPLHRLVRAYHPLLLLRAGNDRDKVVPLSLELNPQHRIVLVSGPNAGGKSVSLKTLGLLSIMLQSGLLVPVQEGSEFRAFRHIMVDIGDEQSIASDLSTYTSHLRNMSEMLRTMDGGSLFLIDEFGAGTDPRLGGAMAQAFLERFLTLGGYGMITTHYGNLKSFAQESDGILNAAMEFDPVSLSPTFRLETGTPGRSYAFEIARKVGIPQEVIESARGKVSQEEVYSEELLLSLEKRKAELERVLNENRKINGELKTLMEKNRALQNDLARNKAKLMQEARSQAQGLIDQANRKIEATIREIREAQAEKERTRELRAELAQLLPAPLAEEAMALEEEREPTPEELPHEPIAEGDWVKFRDSGTYGTVLELKDKRAIVSAGDLRLTVKLKDLVKIRQPQAAKPLASLAGTAVIRERKTHAQSSLDIQGMRVEAALPVVSQFMDDALLAGIKEVRILHGKGTGALRIAIRDWLRQQYAEIQSMEDAHADRGGAGWTVVTLQ